MKGGCHPPNVFSICFATAIHNLSWFIPATTYKKKKQFKISVYNSRYILPQDTYTQNILYIFNTCMPNGKPFLLKPSGTCVTGNFSTLKIAQYAKLYRCNNGS